MSKTNVYNFTDKPITYKGKEYVPSELKLFITDDSVTTVDNIETRVATVLDKDLLWSMQNGNDAVFIVSNIHYYYLLIEHCYIKVYLSEGDKLVTFSYPKKMIPVVINVAYGGFGLSRAMAKRLLDIKSKEILENFYLYLCSENTSKVLCDNLECECPACDDIVRSAGMFFMENRCDTDLINFVNTYPADAVSKYAKLKVVEVNDNSVWHVGEHDGKEHIEYR